MATPSIGELLARLEEQQELGGGASSTPFAYRIVARRKDVSAPRLRRVTPPDAPAHEAG
jgi:hypothetical protein